MKFSAIHKLASYLMAASAFAALATSGELSIIAVGLGALGIVLSWFWEAPRIKPARWTMLWNALGVLAFLYTFITAISSGEWVANGAHLLVFLLCAKLLSRRSSRDYQWVYVIPFLMLVAATSLNAEVSYALCFLLYIIFTTWALILFHLRREMEDNFLVKHSDDSSSERVEVERILSSRRIVGARFLVATSSVSLIIFILSSIIFFLFPRVGFGLFFQRSRSSITFAGFRDGVTLGGHGLIRTDDTVVMRIKVSDPRYRGDAAPELHWRGVAFDQYAGGKWSRSGRAFGTRFRWLPMTDRTRVVFGSADRLPSWETRALRQEIYLEPLDTSTLFAASMPVALEIETVAGTSDPHGRLGQNDEIRVDHQAGLRYVIYSDTRQPDEQTLRAAPDADPQVMAAYLEIPPEVPARVGELAQRVVDAAGAHTAYEKTMAVYRYLRANYGYTLEQDTDESREPLDFFLFDRKKGHCEYFSSAMAILLRAVGVPTRNVNGFLGGEWNEFGGYIAVRSGDAHSWVEVWLDPVGWVTFDPTPPGQAQALGRGGGGVLDKLRRMVDTLRLQWFKWVIEYDLGQQMALVKKIGGLFGFGKGSWGKGASTWVKKHREPILGGLGGAVTLIAFVAWRRRRTTKEPEAAGAPPPSHPILVLYRRSARRLARRGFPKAPAQTPREHARQLALRSAPGATPFAALTELYYTVRWAASPDLRDRVSVDDASRLAEEVRRAARSDRAARGAAE